MIPLTPSSVICNIVLEQGNLHSVTFFASGNTVWNSFCFLAFVAGKKYCIGGKKGQKNIPLMVDRYTKII